MIEKTLARRYAAALLKATEAEGTTEDVEQSLRALREVWRSNRPFRSVLAQPRVPKAKKAALLRKPFEGRTSRAFLTFLDLLIERNRQAIIPDVAEVFDLLADATRGEVRVQVRSWKPLSEDQRKRLQERLEKREGRKVRLEEQADPAVLGGLATTTGFTVVSGTVRDRLKGFGERLRELHRR